MKLKPNNPSLFGIVRPLESQEAEAEKIIVSYVMGAWTEAVKRLTPVETFDSAESLAFEANQIFRRYSGLTSLNEKLKSRWNADESYHRAAFVNDINSAIGVDINDMIETEARRLEVVKRVNESADLITTLSKELSRKIGREIWDMAQRGEDNASIRKFILDRKSGYPEWRAKLIARDQTLKLFGNLTELSHRDLGIDSYIWSTVRDGAVRDTHEEREGQEYKWNSDDIKPGQEIQCRCVAALNSAIVRRSLFAQAA
jgi:SPP1 gp7 family putative phage head morphogenesis protein